MLLQLSFGVLCFGTCRANDRGHGHHGDLERFAFVQRTRRWSSRTGVRRRGPLADNATLLRNAGKCRRLCSLLYAIRGKVEWLWHALLLPARGRASFNTICRLLARYRQLVGRSWSTSRTKGGQAQSLIRFLSQLPRPFAKPSRCAAPTLPSSGLAQLTS